MHSGMKLVAVIAAVLTMLLVASLLMSGGMMGGGMMNGLMGGGMLLGMLVFWGLITVLVVALAVWVVKQGQRRSSAKGVTNDDH